jgi:LDH2 family malate/lactate/ureidoglycolate dehydrogenase
MKNAHKKNKNEYLVKEEKLRDFCHKILKVAGIPDKDVGIISDSLIFADLRGVGSHGVIKLKDYIDKINAESMASHTEIQVLKENASTILIDANNGFGQIAGLKAMEYCVTKASKTGIGSAGVRNSNNFGAAAYLAMQALNNGMIGIVITNTAPTVPPWGGAQPMLGTNPIAVAIPAGEELPIVLDMATTVVARGKIRVAAQKNEKIPFGWALDSTGTPTEDPLDALHGFLMPIGGPKGYGLSLIISILTGVLCGSVFSTETKPLADASAPSRFSHFMATINVDSLINLNNFRTQMDSLIRKIKSCPKQNGIDEVYLPGELEYIKMNERKKNGIPLPESTINKIETLAKNLGLSINLLN